MNYEPEFKLECLPEDIPVRGNFASGDDAADKALEDEILERLERGDDWAWCCVKVTCAIARNGERFEGEPVFLGGCSYRDEKDFVENSMYYDEMKKEAEGYAMREVEDAVERGKIAAELIAERAKEG